MADLSLRPPRRLPSLFLALLQLVALAVPAHAQAPPGAAFRARVRALAELPEAERLPAADALAAEVMAGDDEQYQERMEVLEAELADPGMRRRLAPLVISLQEQWDEHEAPRRQRAHLMAVGFLIGAVVLGAATGGVASLVLAATAMEGLAIAGALAGTLVGAFGGTYLASRGRPEPRHLLEGNPQAAASISGRVSEAGGDETQRTPAQAAAREAPAPPGPDDGMPSYAGLIGGPGPG